MDGTTCAEVTIQAHYASEIFFCSIENKIVSHNRQTLWRKTD